MCQKQHSLKHAAIQQHGRDTAAVSAIESCENLFLFDISDDHQVLVPQVFLYLFHHLH